ncbi:MAG: multiheme c-type cytochrome [Myxococcota bacterium]|nr:multiheme c-type cytochrome [Myxococcota bacterium]
MLWFLSCFSVEESHNEERFQSRPSYMRTKEPVSVPDGLSDISAKSCGACHETVYAQWRKSTHAHAWLEDPQFQAELKKEREGGGDVQWMCLNCHTPLSEQQPKRVVGIKDKFDQPIYEENPNYIPGLELEAVGCAACHLQGNEIIGTKTIEDGPHKVRKEPTFGTPQFCNQCHQANAVFPEINLGCFFNTGKEHAQGPFAEQPCQSCHMPEVDGVRAHYFGGSLIPKQPQYAADIEEMSTHYRHGLTVQLASISWGKEASASIVYQNRYAGHMLPSGDPERFIEISMEILSEAGVTIAKEEVWIGSKYQWWPKIQLEMDNRLHPQEERTMSVSWLPKDEVYTLVVRAVKGRISEENLQYHNLEGLVVPSVEFFVLRETLTPF